MGGVEKREREEKREAMPFIKKQKALAQIYVLIGLGPRHILFYPH